MQHSLPNCRFEFGTRTGQVTTSTPIFWWASPKSQNRTNQIRRLGEKMARRQKRNQTKTKQDQRFRRATKAHLRDKYENNVWAAVGGRMDRKEELLIWVDRLLKNSIGFLRTPQAASQRKNGWVNSKGQAIQDISMVMSVQCFVISTWKSSKPKMRHMTPNDIRVSERIDINGKWLTQSNILDNFEYISYQYTRYSDIVFDKCCRWSFVTGQNECWICYHNVSK